MLHIFMNTSKFTYSSDRMIFPNIPVVNPKRRINSYLKVSKNTFPGRLRIEHIAEATGSFTYSNLGILTKLITNHVQQ